MKLSDLKLDDKTLTLKTIIRNCSYYFDQINNRPDKYILYRGMKSNTISSEIEYQDNDVTIYLKGVRKNRLPLTTGNRNHARFDSYFDQLFGVPYRTVSLFATGSYLQAEEYARYSEFGKVFVILPKGNFTFIWSPSIRDLYLNANVIQNIDMAKKHYTNKDLISAIHSGSEIMIDCDAYYAIDAKNYISFAKDLTNILTNNSVTDYGSFDTPKAALNYALYTNKRLKN